MAIFNEEYIDRYMNYDISMSVDGICAQLEQNIDYLAAESNFDISINESEHNVNYYKAKLCQLLEDARTNFSQFIDNAIHLFYVKLNKFIANYPQKLIKNPDVLMKALDLANQSGHVLAYVPKYFVDDEKFFDRNEGYISYIKSYEQNEYVLSDVKSVDPLEDDALFKKYTTLNDKREDVKITSDVADKAIKFVFNGGKKSGTFSDLEELKKKCDKDINNKLKEYKSKSIDNYGHTNSQAIDNINILKQILKNNSSAMKQTMKIYNYYIQNMVIVVRSLISVYNSNKDSIDK